MARLPTSRLPTSKLPPSLSIALWLIGSIWLVALLAHVFDAPREIVFAALIFGLFSGAAEWLALRRRKH
jgi:hypothetical protein